MIRRKKMLGIVIGRDEVRMVEMVLTSKNRFYITKYATLELGTSVLNEGVVVDEEKFANEFGRMYKENGFSARTASFGIDNQTTILRFATFPKVEQSKQRNLILLNSQEHIPTPLSELELDYVPLREVEEEEGTFVNILLCAVNKKTIQQIIDVSKLVPLSLTAISPIQISFANAMLSKVTENSFLAVRMGRKSVHHIVFEDNHIEFIRHVNLNTETITTISALIRGEKVPFSDIDSIKKQFVNSINASINYYNLKSKIYINHIYLSGVSSVYRQISEGLEEELQSDVNLVRLFEPDGKLGASPPEEYDGCISLVLDSVR